MRIEAGPCSLRPLALPDAAPLAALADDPAVARNLRDLFPRPYGLRDAVEFITVAMLCDPTRDWAIEADGDLAGVIGYRRGTDVYCRSAEMGYWLGRPFWGRGLATAAVGALCRHLFATLDLERIHAGVFGGNEASARVLAKAGFRREGTMRRHVLKDGQIKDEWLFGLIRGDLE